MKNLKFLSVLAFIFLIGIYSCEKNKKQTNKETILKGKATIYVDETLMPIVEDLAQVFESQYNAELTLIAKSESEITQAISLGKTDLFVLSRELSASESKIFTNKKVIGKITPFAYDGIGLVTQKNEPFNEIKLSELINCVSGKNSIIKSLVFDNPNSSTVRYIKELAKIKNLTKNNIFSFQTNTEVVTFVSKNKGSVGVVGVNWLSQPSNEIKNIKENIKILAINTGKISSKPTQETIGTAYYPLNRQIKLLNYQGYSGLGMGFASFIAGELGQRIILQSGLAPVRMPSRNINIVKSIKK